MDKDLLDFLCKYTNATIQGGLAITREESGNGADLISFKTLEGGTLWQVWETQASKEREPISLTGSRAPPRRKRGGVASYVQLQIKPISDLHDAPNRGDALGLVASLASCIEWGTGKVSIKAGRSRKAATIDDMAKAADYSLSRTKAAVKVLKDKGFISKQSDGWYVSPKLIKKGTVKNNKEGLDNA